MSTGIGVGVSSVFGGVKASPSFEYSGSAFCANATPDPTPTINGTTGGTFTSAPVAPSTGTLVINATTGTIDLSASDPGNYLVTYTVGGVSESDPFEVLPVQTTSFSYSSNSFQDTGIATPTITGSAGGVFTATTGLVVDNFTGVIDLGASTVGGPYTVTYTNTGACQGTPSTFDVSITATVRIIANNFALDFNGTDEYIGVNYNSIFDQAQYSFSLWIKNTQNNINSDKGILCADANGNRGFALQQNGQNLKWDSNISGSSSQLLDANFFDTISTWVHCAVAYDGSSLKMYKNGQLQETVSSSTSNMNANNNNITIGNNPFTTGRFFSGDMDEVAVWNKAISANAVQEIYNATTNNPGFTADLFKLANESQAPVYWNRMGDD